MIPTNSTDHLIELNWTGKDLPWGRRAICGALLVNASVWVIEAKMALEVSRRVDKFIFDILFLILGYVVL